METLFDFGQEISKIRDALDTMEVRGQHNASVLVYCYQKCNDMIQSINNIAAEVNRQRQAEAAEEEHISESAGDLDE